MSTPWIKDWTKDWQKSEWKHNDTTPAQWSKSAIRRGLGLELPRNFKPDSLFLDELDRQLDLEIDRSILNTPSASKGIAEQDRRLNLERLRRDPLNGFTSLRYGGQEMETYEPEASPAKNWLWEWVLPLLFTLLTLACLALLAAEALPPQGVSSPMNNSSASVSLNAPPVVISAFSG
ncbi:MAG: hypothetical protein VKJ04_08320 [Vampirovibrionales bacterium]|nr:hypothetical protein [Vampirovibrionales bacterium]